ncbi:MAG: hypothetical protein ACRC9R_06185 [Enterovibrio sp.]
MNADLPSHEDALEIYLADLLTENSCEADSSSASCVLDVCSLENAQIQKDDDNFSTQSLLEPVAELQVKQACDLDDAKSQSELPYASDIAIFDVSGITYALPSNAICAVYPDFVNELEPIADKNWHLGIFHHAGEEVHVVDLTGWADPLFELPEQNLSYSHLIVLNSKLALACHSLTTGAKLEHASAIWRKKAGKRAWLAGFVKEPACALLLIETLISALEQSIQAIDQHKK